MDSRVDYCSPGKRLLTSALPLIPYKPTYAIFVMQILQSLQITRYSACESTDDTTHPVPLIHVFRSGSRGLFSVIYDCFSRSSRRKLDLHTNRFVLPHRISHQHEATTTNPTVLHPYPCTNQPSGFIARIQKLTNHTNTERRPNKRISRITLSHDQHRSSLSINRCHLQRRKSVTLSRVARFITGGKVTYTSL